MLRPLAVPKLERVVTVAEQRPGGSYEPAAIANYQDWIRNSRSFEELAIRKETGITLTGAGDAEQTQAVTYIPVRTITSNIFLLFCAQMRTWAESITRKNAVPGATLWRF